MEERYCLAFDVGGSSIKCALISEKGKVGVKLQRSTPKSLEEFYAALAGLRAECGGKLEGAAFSFPGAVDTQMGIIGGASAIDYIHNFDIMAQLGERLGLRVTMENDANCAALGEAWLGAAKGCKDVLFVVCGSGIGGAVVKDGRVHHGAHLHGGEFGYMLVSRKEGGYETLSQAGAPVAVARRLGERLGVKDLDGKTMFALAETGDEEAVAAVEAMYTALGEACYNLQYVYDPELIILGGGVSARADFAPEVERHAARVAEAIAEAKITPRVVACKFGNDANLLGAARHFFTTVPHRGL